MDPWSMSAGVALGAAANRSRRRRPRYVADFLRRPRCVAAYLASFCFAASAAVSVFHWPLPEVHDEFSYLLAADTFARGRLTNPTHPHWQHFETFHVIQQPSYASKYPPGQGAVLALGQLLTGQPIVGVWILSAATAAALYWMLLGWTSPRFAALGGLLWAAHPGFQLAWGQSYWGGTLAFLGGALVFGAAMRMQRRARALDAIAMGAGAVILAASRPFEGLIFCLCTGAWVVWHWARSRWPARRDFALTLALPMAIVLSLGGIALGTYHAAVTGDALDFPYSIHEATYGQCPMFLGQPPAPAPAYRHAAIEEFHTGWEMDWHRLQSSPRGWVNTKISVSWYALQFLLTPIMMGCVLLARPWRWRRLSPVAVVASLTYLASLTVTWNLPHYIAPLAPLLVIVAVFGLRRLDVLSRLHWGGFPIASALVAAQAALFMIAAVQHGAAPHGGWSVARKHIIDQLFQTPQRHLILVRYGPNHNPHQEWVFNAADIDAAKIVWARSMNPARDAELLQYFGDRQAWLLEPEARQLRCITAGDLRESVNERTVAVPLQRSRSSDQSARAGAVAAELVHRGRP
jgi:hypothetical protein